MCRMANSKRNSWARYCQHLSRNLRAQRDAAGDTNERIAGRLGVTRWTVSRWMAGRYAPSLEHLHRLCGVWRIRLEQLLPPDV